MEREKNTFAQMKPKNSNIKENTTCNERPKKRRKHGRKDGKHWTVANSAVEPELLADLGVGHLIESHEYTDSEPEEETATSEPQKPTSPANKLNLLTPDNSQEPEATLPLDSDFFVFRRLNQSQPPISDPFTKLSDEIVLMVFSFLPKITLVRTASVCKRWQRISYDETLWIRLDLSGRSLHSNAMVHILNRGTTVMRLAQSEFDDPVLFEDCLDVSYKLQYLDLSMAVISEAGLSRLLGACTQLRKLSLEHCGVDAGVCGAVALNARLEVLNLSMSRGLDHTGLAAITAGCTALTTLNVAWTQLDWRAITLLCTSLSSKLQRLNLAGCRKTLRDSDVESLVLSCPGLVELDMSDSVVLSQTSVAALMLLPKLEHLALSRCYALTPATLKRFSRHECLRFLDVFNLMQESTLLALQMALPAVKLNAFVCSSIARPTVGIRRTSIWGLRVRD